MRNTVLRVFAAAAVLLGAGVAGAATGGGSAPLSDADVTKSVIHEIRMYPYYGIWDNITISVANGAVELSGQVTEPYKKADLERRVRQVPGVESVAGSLQVLPLSPFDNRLRLEVARAIYGTPGLDRYGMQPVPSIHVIVDGGHVTLEGVVATQSEKDLAGIRASGAGLSFGPITNNLVVERHS